METNTDIEKVIEVAQQAAKLEPRIGHVDSVPYALLREDENIKVLGEVLSEVERRQPAPARRIGTSRHTELSSFITHINRYKLKQSTVWANIGSLCIEAVFNYHPAGSNPAEAGWGDHRALYTCPLSPEWQVWTQMAGSSLTSEEFAEFIETQMEDLTDGQDCASPVELLETARNLQIHTKGVFIKKVNPETGEYHMVAKEEHDKQSSTKIPRKFALALRVFEGGQQYLVQARIEFRVRDGRPLFKFKLVREKEMVRDAFNDVRAAVEKETKLVVFAGTTE